MIIKQVVMEREAWRAAVHGVRVRLSDWTELKKQDSLHSEHRFKVLKFELIELLYLSSKLETCHRKESVKKSVQFS